MGCFQQNVPTVMMVVFNIVLALAGLALISVGVIVHEVFSEFQFQDFLDSQVTGPPVVVIVFGVVVFVLTFVGFYAAKQESSRGLKAYILLLLPVVTTAFVLSFVISIHRHDPLSLDEVATRMTNTLEKYRTDPHAKATMDALQGHHYCCGASGPNDYLAVFADGSLPASCCDGNGTETCTTEDERVYEYGCVLNLEEFVQICLSWLGLGTFSFATLALVGLSCAVFLENSVRNRNGRHMSTF